MTLAELIVKLGLDATAFNEGLAGVDRQTAKMSREVDKMGQSFERFGGALTGIGLALTATITAPLAAVSVAALKVAGNMEQAKVGFTNMLGSADKARAMLEQLRDFAMKTPFEMPGLVTASQRLLAMGFSAKQVIPVLTSIGDAVAAMGGSQEVLNRVVLAFGQIQAKGKLAAEEMRQLTEAGIPAWDMLARKLGVDVAQAMKMVEARAVDANTAITALQQGIQERFGGMMEMQSKTLAGMWSNLKDQITKTLDAIGQALLPVGKKIIEWASEQLRAMSDLAAAFGKLPPSVQAFSLALAAAAAALGPLLMGVGQVASGIGAMHRAVAAILPMLGMGTGMAGMLTALGVAAAAAAAAFTAWEAGKFVAQIRDIERELGLVINPIQVLKDAADAAVGWVVKLFPDDAQSKILKIKESLASAAQEVRGFVETVRRDLAGVDWKAMFSGLGTAALSEMNKGLSQVREGFRTLFPSMEQVKNALTGLNEKMRPTTEWAAEWSKLITAKVAPDSLLGALTGLGIKGTAQLQAELEAAKKYNAIIQASNEAWTVKEAALKKVKEATEALYPAINKLAEAFKTLGATSFASLEKDAEKASKAYQTVFAAFQRGKADISDVERAFAGMQRAQQAVIDAYEGMVRAQPDFLSGFYQPGMKAAEAVSLLAFNTQAARAQMEALTTAFEGFVTASRGAKDASNALMALMGPLAEIEAAYQSLGAQSTKALEERVTNTKAYYDTIVSLEGAASHNALLAERNYLQAVIEARRAAGAEITAEETARYKYLEDLLGKHKETVLRFFDVLSGIMRNVTREVSDAFGKLIIEGGNWAESMMSIVKKVAETIISTLVEGALNDLLHQFGLLSDKAWAAGDSLIRLFGGVADTATKAAKAAATIAVPGTAAGAAAPGVPAAAGAPAPAAPVTAAGGAAGWMGITDMITGAVSAITGVLQYLQNRRMEQDLGRIEVTTREQKSILLSINDTLREFLPVLPDLHETLWKVYGYVSAIYDQVMAAITGRTGEATAVAEEIANAVQEVVEELGGPNSALDALDTTTSQLTYTVRQADEALGNVAASSDAVQEQLENLDTSVQGMTNAFTDASEEITSASAEYWAALERQNAALGQIFQLPPVPRPAGQPAPPVVPGIISQLPPMPKPLSEALAPALGFMGKTTAPTESTAREDLWLDPLRPWLTVQKANAERMQEQLELNAETVRSWGRYPMNEWPAGLQEQIMQVGGAGRPVTIGTINITGNTFRNREDMDYFFERMTRELQFSGA